MYKYNPDYNGDIPLNPSNGSIRVGGGKTATATLTDLTRFNHFGRYSLVNEWNFQESAHNVQTLHAINSIQSPYILSSTSDK